MKVKTFVVGLAGGVEVALKKLDEEVARLGDVEILDVQDTLYPNMHEIQDTSVYDPCLARRVIYKAK
jgi:hypothetical protein